MNWLGNRFRNSDAFAGLIICVLVCAGVIGVRYIGILEPTELALYDLYLRQQPQVSQPEDRIVIVTVSEDDIRRLGSWPMNDGLLARVLKNLLAHQPRVIGLDIFRNIQVPPGTEELKELFAVDIPVVLVKKFGDRISPGVPGPFMAGTGSPVGFSDALVDDGGITRRGLLFMDDGVESSTSFGLLLAAVYLQKEGIGLYPDPANPELLKFGKTVFTPLDSEAGGYIRMDARGYQFLLDFTSAKTGFATISLTDVLAGEFPGEAVRDRIVLIGATAESLRDYFYIPISRSREEGQRVYGIEVHATMISQLLRCAVEGREPVKYLPDSEELCWIALWGVLGYLVGLKVHHFRWFSVLLLIIPGVLAGITFVLFMRGLWIPVTPPVFAFLLSADSFRLYMLSVEKRHRATLMRLFERHVSKDIAEAIWEQREQFIHDGLPRPQQLTATVLFTDLRNFTTISEQFGNARKLMEWLNEYMEAMTTHVLDNGGVVNKYIGDAIMAVFGVPVARENEREIAEDAVNAVRCAIMMGKRLEELNRKWKAENLPTVRMRVGIYTGPLMVGCIGSKQRLEYTVIGDTVNVASRLESFDKEFDSENTCRILLGRSTWKYAANQFECKCLGSIALKGKDESLEVFHLTGPMRSEKSECGATRPHSAFHPVV